MHKRAPKHRRRASRFLARIWSIFFLLLSIGGGASILASLREPIGTWEGQPPTDHQISIGASQLMLSNGRVCLVYPYHLLMSKLDDDIFGWYDKSAWHR